MSRILIIEDEESIAELEKDYLELSGFEVEIENQVSGLLCVLHSSATTGCSCAFSAHLALG